MNNNAAQTIQRFMQYSIHNKRECDHRFLHSHEYTKKQLLQCIKLNLRYYKHRSILFEFFPYILEIYDFNVNQASIWIYNSLKKMPKKALVNILQGLTNNDEYTHSEYNRDFYCEKCYPEERMRMTNPIPDESGRFEYPDENHNEYYHTPNCEISRYHQDSALHSARQFISPRLPGEIVDHIFDYVVIPLDNQDLFDNIRYHLNESSNAIGVEANNVAVVNMYNYLISVIPSLKIHFKSMIPTMITKANELMEEERTFPGTKIVLQEFINLITN